jgi:L-2-hydroxyglutarate oxidase LhgO
LVNAAGLGAQRLAQMLGIKRPCPIPSLFPCKGNYLKFNKKSPFSQLIYPVPHPSLKGLGIHGTLDLQGQLRFGPNARYLNNGADPHAYGVDPNLEKDFAAAICHYFPAIRPEDLSPDYAGVRPKLAGPGQGFADFAIHRQADHGLPGLIELFGIESPGLTASLAIAELLAAELQQHQLLTT